MAVLDPLEVVAGSKPLQPVHTRAAWTVPEVLQLEDEWKIVLTDADRQEIIAATKHAIATGKPIPVRFCWQAASWDTPWLRAAGV